MSLVVVARDAGRWPLGHGQDPVDVLAEHGWAGEPLRAVRGADDVVEVHYEVTPLADEARPAAVEVSGGRAHQRLAAYAIVVDEGRLLMSQLSERVTSGAGLWTLPGGGVDPGEEPLAGVVREVHEETGQHIIAGPLVQVQSHHWVGAVSGPEEHEDFHAVRLIHRASCPSPTAATVMEIDGSTGAAAWIPLDEVPRLELAGLVREAWPWVPGGKSYLM